MTSSRETQPALRRLSRLNPTVMFLVTGVLAFAGFALPGPIGGLVLLALAGGLIALLARTWPLHPPRTRVLRVLILGALIAVALTRLLT